MACLGLCNKTVKIWHVLVCPLYSICSSTWILFTSIWGCVTQWPWPISSRLFSCDVAYFMDYIHVAQIQPMKGQCVPYHFSVKGQGHTQGFSQPKIFTHRQWPLFKPNKTYRPQSPKKSYYVYHIYLYMYMLKMWMRWFSTNGDSL